MFNIGGCNVPKITAILTINNSVQIRRHQCTLSTFPTRLYSLQTPAVEIFQRILLTVWPTTSPSTLLKAATCKLWSVKIEHMHIWCAVKLSRKKFILITVHFTKSEDCHKKNLHDRNLHSWRYRFKTIMTNHYIPFCFLYLDLTIFCQVLPTPPVSWLLQSFQLVRTQLAIKSYGIVALSVAFWHVQALSAIYRRCHVALSSIHWYYHRYFAIGSYFPRVSLLWCKGVELTITPGLLKKFGTHFYQQRLTVTTMKIQAEAWSIAVSHLICLWPLLRQS